MSDVRRQRGRPARNFCMRDKGMKRRMKRLTATIALGLLGVRGPARAQSQPDAGVGPSQGPSDASTGNPQAHRLIVSPRFVGAVRRCEERRDPGAGCGAYETMLADGTVTSEAVSQILAAGEGSSSENPSSGVTRAEALAPLGESAEAVASAAALFEAATMGLASFLVDRARVELQRGASDAIRRQACVAGGAARELLQHTCALLGADVVSLGSGPRSQAPQPDADARALGAPTFGAGLRAALERDILELPMRAEALSERGGGSQRGPDLARRLALGLAVSLAREPSPLAVADALSSRIETGDVDMRDGVRLFRAIALAVSVASAEGGPRSTVVRARIVQTAWLAVMGSRVSDERLPQLFELGRAAFDAQRAAMDLGDPSLSDATRRSRIASFAGNLVRALRASISLVASSRGARGTVSGEREGVARALERVVPMFDAMATGDVARVLAATLGLLREVDAMPSDAASAVRVLTLGAEFVSARTARQAEAAIMAFAAPPGSWQARFDRSGLWINGFVGVGGGAEWLFESGGRAPLGAFFAPFAPIGFDYTVPFASNQWAGGLFVSVIDLGALINASTVAGGLTPTQTMTGMMNTPTVMPRTSTHPGQFLAPGLYGRLNLGRTPLVLSAGASVLPFGREVDYGMGRVETLPAVRVGGSLSVDIPIVPFTF
jgi:hypothetical protein